MKEIAICPHCNEPLILTMIFPGAEYYCLMCGSSYGMLSVSKTLSSEELNYKKKQYEKIFKILAKDIIPYGCYFNKCEKCKKFEDTHAEHATEKEWLKDKVSRNILDKIGNYW